MHTAAVATAAADMVVVGMVVVDTVAGVFTVVAVVFTGEVVAFMAVGAVFTGAVLAECTVATPVGSEACQAGPIAAVESVGIEAAPWPCREPADFMADAPAEWQVWAVPAASRRARVDFQDPATEGCHRVASRRDISCRARVEASQAWARVAASLVWGAREA
jgi:hypothetical protein